MALGPWQIALIVVIILVFFVGPKKLPELSKSLGKSIRDFKKALKEDEDALDVTNSAKAEKIEGHYAESKKENISEKERS